jgi:hypothetical protein
VPGNGTPETGANAGSDFHISNFTDAGAVINMPILIRRSSGTVALGGFTNGVIDTDDGGVSLRCSPTAHGVNIRAMAAGVSNYLLAFYNSSAASVGFVSSNDTATNYSTASDARLKQTVQDFDSGAIVDALRPVRHNWIDHPDVWSHGVLAQEAHAVHPEAVVPGTGDPGDRDFLPWGIDYSKFVPVLLAELKALRARVQSLENIGTMRLEPGT